MAAIEQAERFGGAGLLGVPAFDFFVWLLDTYARGDLLMSLHEQLPPALLNPGVGFLCVCGGFGLLYMSHKRQVAALRESGHTIVDSTGVEYHETSPKWARPVAGVVLIALLAAPLLAVAYSLAYRGNSPEAMTQRPPEIAYAKSPKSPPAGAKGGHIIVTGHDNIVGNKVTGNNNVLGNNNVVNPPIDPNQPVTTYDFDGLQRTRTPSGIEINQNEEVILNDIIEKSRAKDWKGVLSKSEQEKQKIPAWPTPYYLSGVALANLCQTDGAIANLENFISKSPTGATTYSDGIADAKKLLDILKTQGTVCH